MYTQPLAIILKNHDMHYHLYADDTQIYKSVNFENIQDLKLQTEDCIKNVKNWMNINKLKLNDNKTEVILCHSPRQSIQGMSISLNINGHEIKNSCKIRNLGVIFDENLSMSDQVTSICQKSYFQLRKIASVRNYLTEFATTTLVTTLILSNLDYCNSLLSGITNDNLKKLQSIQNFAAKVIKRKKKYDHVTPILFDLHWLPVEQRIIYKICLLCYKALNGCTPSYLSDLIPNYVPNRTLRSSSDQRILSKPKTHYKFYGERSFSFFGPSVWNDLPLDLRYSSSVNTFKKKLKHHLFVETFNAHF